jgi:hypothetical protein
MRCVTAHVNSLTDQDEAQHQRQHHRRALRPERARESRIHRHHVVERELGVDAQDRIARRLREPLGR